LAAIDYENIAEEILDLGRSVRNELRHRMTLLLMHLIKWQYQSGHRSKSWLRTIKDQRLAISISLRKVPSLKSSLNDPDWWTVAWADACRFAEKETGLELETFPETNPWVTNEILSQDWLPD
jgi:hypothetical protein